jgi:hypothetical protein
MFDVTVTWNKAKDGDNLAQVTVTAVVTDETLAALPEINPWQNGYHDTAPSPVTSTAVGHSAEPPIAGPTPHGRRRDRGEAGCARLSIPAGHASIARPSRRAPRPVTRRAPAALR